MTSLFIRRAVPREMADVIRIDDDATSLYAEAGIAIQLDGHHPFTQAEQARWLESATRGDLFMAVDGGHFVGFAALGFVDGAPYLDQLSVQRSAMRRGVGRTLLRHAVEWAKGLEGSALWLTTYAHLPFNRAFYEREGFVGVPEAECGPDIRHHLREQRRYLPLPDQRVAMRYVIR